MDERVCPRLCRDGLNHRNETRNCVCRRPMRQPSSPSTDQANDSDPVNRVVSARAPAQCPTSPAPGRRLPRTPTAKSKGWHFAEAIHGKSRRRADSSLASLRTCTRDGEFPALERLRTAARRPGSGFQRRGCKLFVRTGCGLHLGRKEDRNRRLASHLDPRPGRSSPAQVSDLSSNADSDFARPRTASHIGQDFHDEGKANNIVGSEKGD